MKTRTMLTAAFAALTLALGACGAKTTNSSTASKPANASSPAANSNSAAKSGAKPPEPKTELKNEKKPEGQQSKAVPSDKKTPVPSNWIYYADEVKGYGFWLPEGSKGDSGKMDDGSDIFIADTPAPNDINVIVMAWKDRTLTKEDLLKIALDSMRDDFGETVSPGKLTGESDDYALADATSTDKDGKKWKMRILVGTDVTDNYVMIVSSPEDKFDANKQTIDAIWGNFEMYSGGASGTS